MFSLIRLHSHGDTEQTDTESKMETDERALHVCFIGEWFDPHPQVVKTFLIKYYVESHSVEIKDLTTGRKFLKRTPIPPSASLSEQDFRVGRQVLLFSRNMKLIEYGDEATKQLLEASSEETAVVISSKVVKEGELGNVVALLERSVGGLQVVMMKALHATDNCVATQGLSVREQCALNNSDGLAVAIVMQGEGSIDKVRRALVEDGRYVSSVYSTASTAEAAKAKEALFNRSEFPAPHDEEGKSNRSNEDCTCCVIKPHAIKSRQVGGILQSISDAGYDIDDLGLFHLDGNAAREFLEVYNGGAVKNLHLMVQEMCSGPVIALRVCRRSGEGNRDAVSAFRADVAGPWDCEMARELHPATLRARYGIDNVQNAVHCTDLSGDGSSECHFFFEILSGA
mmetsp:Transcript_20739/g.59449  ORF Transcript_20739/g.59449 Transcript_20739/m.59449 type:complete len:398 (+) Transcript_20739:2552-3745(+)